MRNRNRISKRLYYPIYSVSIKRSLLSGHTPKPLIGWLFQYKSEIATSRTNFIQNAGALLAMTWVGVPTTDHFFSGLTQNLWSDDLFPFFRPFLRGGLRRGRLISQFDCTREICFWFITHLTQSKCEVIELAGITAHFDRPFDLAQDRLNALDK